MYSVDTYRIRQIAILDGQIVTLQGVTGALVESCTLGLEFNQMQDMY